MSSLRTAVVCLVTWSGGPAALAQTAPVAANIDYRPRIEVAHFKDRLDVYMPSGADQVPVLIFFHGGALTGGDKQDQLNHRVAPAITDGDIGVVMVNYRLSPTVRHPVHLQDVAAATSWVFENIARYGGDPERIFLGGHSAGGYLATMLVLDPSYLGEHGLEPRRIRGAVPISPFLDVEEVAPDRPKSVWGEDTAVWKRASPITWLTRTCPMLLIVADGDADWRKAQNRRVARELDALGSEVDLIEARGRNHMTLISGLADKDDTVSEAVIEFIRRHADPATGH